jgi:hypothetical protein
MVEHVLSIGCLRPQGSNTPFMKLNYHANDRMVATFLDRQLVYGLQLADVDDLNHTVLAIVTQSTLACRAGKICRTDRYPLQYLRLGDIEFTALTPHFEDLQAKVILRWRKGFRLHLYDNFICRVGVLDHAPHICFISWLLVTCLRRGAIRGDSYALKHAIALANQNPFHAFQILQPDAPLILSNGQPATRDWFAKRLERVGLIAGVKDRVTTHSLRHGAAADSIYLGLVGPVQAISLALGHDLNDTDVMRTTHLYTGDSPRCFMVERAQKVPMVPAYDKFGVTGLRRGLHTSALQRTLSELETETGSRVKRGRRRRAEQELYWNNLEVQYDPPRGLFRIQTRCD